AKSCETFCTKRAAPVPLLVTAFSSPSPLWLYSMGEKEKSHQGWLLTLSLVPARSVLRPEDEFAFVVEKEVGAIALAALLIVPVRLTKGLCGFEIADRTLVVGNGIAPYHARFAGRNVIEQRHREVLEGIIANPITKARKATSARTALIDSLAFWRSASTRRN